MILQDLIGIPYLKGGRNIKGVDCYGLVKLYYKNILDIDIPETKIMPEQSRRIMINYLNELAINWDTHQEPKKHDVVAFCYDPKHPKIVTHFGIMIDNKKVLHCLGKINSHIDDIDSPRIKPFIKAFHTWQQH